MSDTPMALFGLLQDTIHGLKVARSGGGWWVVDHEHTCRNGIWLYNEAGHYAFLDVILRKVFYGENGETDITAEVQAALNTWGNCRELKIPQHLMNEAIERAGRDIETLPKWHRKNIEVTRLNPSPSELRAAMKRASKAVEKLAPWRELENGTEPKTKTKKTETKKTGTQKGSNDE